MDSIEPSPLTNGEEGEYKSFSHKQVTAIIDALQATPSDYLIETYLRIFSIKNGPTFDKFQRRFSNIIFNNVNKISKQLTLTVFVQKAQEILTSELARAPFISYIYPNKLAQGVCPVFVQYFNVDVGIEQRLLGYARGTEGLGVILAQNELLGKLTGYCGDFMYNDPFVEGYRSDHSTSLRVLNGAPVRYLPYSDGFIDSLFDLLLDYLPEDVSTGLTKLGEVFVRTSSKSQLAQTAAAKYKDWLHNKRAPHILLSEFACYVVEHIQAINSYLEQCRCLPRSVGKLLCSVLQRYLLVFMRELYLKIDQIRILDSSAVAYYFQLLQMRDLFLLYEDNHNVPDKAMKYFQSEMENLTACKQVDEVKDAQKLDLLFGEMVEVVHYTYKRAHNYIDILLKHFPNFDTFSWVLLRESPVDGDKVHESYHVINETTCRQCPQLFQEVNFLNSFLRTLPALEMDSGVAPKWVKIFARVKQQIPIVVELVKYLLCLPASCNLMDDLGDCEHSRAEKMVQFNMKVPEDVVINDVEGFFRAQMAETLDVIRNNQIPLIVD